MELEVAAGQRAEGMRRERDMTDPLVPSPALLAKLGSVLIHVEEFLSDDGHAFDRAAIDALAQDSEIKEWLAAMRTMALVPEQRLPHG